MNFIFPRSQMSSFLGASRSKKCVFISWCFHKGDLYEKIPLFSPRYPNTFKMEFFFYPPQSQINPNLGSQVYSLGFPGAPGSCHYRVPQDAKVKAPGMPNYKMLVPKYQYPSAKLMPSSIYTNCPDHQRSQGGKQSAYLVNHGA